MSDVLGNSLKLMVFGESHSPLIGASISGLPSGIKIDESFISYQLEKRKANDNLSSGRQEDDNFKIVSGVFNGYTTGTPLTILIENSKYNSSDYQEKTFRPGHADYTGELKYSGYQDYRGGGHFSGRLTAPIVAICSIIISYLEDKGIKIGSRIYEIHGVQDEEIIDLPSSINKFNSEIFPTVSDKQKELMKKEILKAKENQDSVGGVIESFIIGLEGGIGNPFFDSLESNIAHSLFSIPGVKGIEFGLGFSFKDKYGSEVSDSLRNVNNKILTSSNNNGGINGGISNGMPIQIKTVIKPTPSIGKEQLTIDSKTKENTTISIKGRHDPCIVRRARVVIDSLLAFTILDTMLSR